MWTRWTARTLDTIRQESNLFVAGVFTIQARCWKDIGGFDNDLAEVRILGPESSSFSGTQTQAGAFENQVDSFDASVAFVDSSLNEVRGGHLTPVAPNGQVVSVSGSAGVGDAAGDCIFGVTIGPWQEQSISRVSALAQAAERRT